MRVIWEENIEGFDYLELILSPTAYVQLLNTGIVKEFKNGIQKRPLNIFLRIDEEADDYIFDYILPGQISMPLIGGKAAKTRKGFSENVKREMEAGKPQKQAVAIAYSQKRGGKKRKGGKA
jgi:hypothetical protein